MEKGHREIFATITSFNLHEVNVFKRNLDVHKQKRFLTKNLNTEYNFQLPNFFKVLQCSSYDRFISEDQLNLHKCEYRGDCFSLGKSTYPTDNHIEICSALGQPKF